MTLLLIIIVWAFGCAFIAYLNARFWKLHPDQEDLQYQQDKAENKPSNNPVKKDSKHLLRIFFRVALLIAVLCILFSCSKDLHSGKSYVVEDVKGSGFVLKLKGIDELYTVPVNTHKPGDTITVWKVRKESKATIY